MHTDTDISTEVDDVTVSLSMMTSIPPQSELPDWLV